MELESNQFVIKLKEGNKMDRRSFVKNGAVATAASALMGCSTPYASVKGSDRIKVGLIGCGGRGTAATCNMISADQNVKIVAVADLFANKPDGSVKKIAEHAKKVAGNKAIEIIDESKVKKFVGWDAVDQLLAEDVDVVIEATPPVFRTPHYEKIVNAGKHAFLEKPACIDITQARKMFELSDLADKKGLSVVCGTQRRYNDTYKDIIKRVQDGEIGEIIGLQAYWYGGYYVGGPQHDAMERAGILKGLAYEDMEYQIRNWFSFIWTSGDNIVEQHVHNLDVIMWALGDKHFPVEVRATGGRSNGLESPKYGDRFSHFSVDFDMGNGLRLLSVCQQDPGCSGGVGERIVGTKGIAYTQEWGGACTISDRKGKVIHTAPKDVAPGLVMEHKCLLDSIRSGKRVNKINQLVNSTLLAIAGRLSAYSGMRFKYEWMLRKSKENIVPEKLHFGKNTNINVPICGKYKLS